MKRIILSILAAALPMAAAQAHVTLEKAEASPSSFYRGVLRLPHGCAGSATTSVRVRIPEGMIAVKPMPKAGWTISLKKESYGKSYNYMHGMTISEGVREITWSGRLEDDFYEEFIFTSYLSDALAPGSTIYLPVLQSCEKGQENWAEIPGAGQSAHSLKAPAPALRIVATRTGPAMPEAVFKAGAIAVENPWLRATPQGADVAGGYMTIVNSGKEPDRLTGGTLVGAARLELHEMSMEGNVMRMRPIKDGIEIKPGATVMLQPGGLHIMGMKLQGPYKPGDTVKGTLQFEKSGRVEIIYTVRPVGAGEGGGHDHH